ncbi:MAG: VCBS repeat-containing protein [Planctomycetota bacterium]
MRPYTLPIVLVATLCPGVAAQRQFDELARRHLPAAAAPALAVALGDVDGDGDADAVLGGRRATQLLLNDGAGRFTDASSRLPTNSDTTNAVTLGDVDGDGDLDLALGLTARRYLPAQNRLYLNDGTGAFADVTATHLPKIDDTTIAVAFTDVDGDGDLDWVSGNRQAASAGTKLRNRLYLNSGNGVFGDATGRIPFDADTTQGVAIGDVDDDGDVDLVFANAGTNRLYLNDGAGQFTAAASLPPDQNDSRAVALADLDGDSDLDLVVGNDGQDQLYLNDGAGGFTAATAGRMPNRADDTKALTIADVDGDADVDLIIGNGGSPAQNRLYLNDGTGSFTDATDPHLPDDQDTTWAVTGGDVDGDGDVDLLFGGLGTSGLTNRLHFNDGAGRFRDGTATRMPPQHHVARAVAVGDVDGDGTPDLLLGTNGPNALYLNDGRGGFAASPAGRLPDNADLTGAAVIGDVDGDGDLDLIAGNSSGFYGQQNRLYLNDGTGSFADVTQGRMPADTDGTAAVALGDVDGDGDLDLVLANALVFFEQQNRLYLNDGTGTFTDVTAARLPSRFDFSRDVAMGDVDRDGDLDLVFANRETNTLYLNDGAGVFTDATDTHMLPAKLASTAVAMGDVDGDGDPDLVFANNDTIRPTPHRNRLYLNDGTGVFSNGTEQLPLDGDPTFAVTFGDVDRDGDLDLVFANYPVRNVAPQKSKLYLNDGAGNFSDATAAFLPDVVDEKVAAVTMADVDGDGDLDLVFANDGRPLLYYNLLRQTEAPFVARLGEAYAVELHARSTGLDLAVPFLATGAAHLPTPWGIFGLDPAQLVALRPVALPQPAGVVSVSVDLPSAPVFASATIYAQALLVRGSTAVLTNTRADVVTAH